MDPFLERADADCRPLWLVSEGEAARWPERLEPAHRDAAGAWAQANGFRGERGRLLLLPAAAGQVAGAVLGLGRLAGLEELTPWHLAAASDRLPGGGYRIADTLGAEAAARAAIGWAMGQYRFDRYRRASETARARLALPPGVDAAEVRRIAAADRLARDLINTPAADLGPAELGEAIAAVARRHRASCHEVVGEALLAAGLPAVHAVGRAAARAPRLVDLRWGAEGPRVTLVGKGVCFDSGGLDLKPSSGMALMKKDMGGAACALALAELVMDAGLRLRLRLLVPAVENSIGSRAYRPGDVLATRKGLSVEVTNTDAEGRLLLADALALADEEGPELLIDLATLTGAARVALGPELPALFASSATLSEQLLAAASASADPLWPLPLWDGYEDEYASKVAEFANASSAGFAGAIIAALFLRRFVAAATPWLHLDLYAWNGRERPGRPVGAEMQTVRALYRLLGERARAQPP